MGSGSGSYDGSSSRPAVFHARSRRRGRRLLAMGEYLVVDQQRGQQRTRHLRLGTAPGGHGCRHSAHAGGASPTVGPVVRMALLAGRRRSCSPPYGASWASSGWAAKSGRSIIGSRSWLGALRVLGIVVIGIVLIAPGASWRFTNRVASGTAGRVRRARLSRDYSPSFRIHSPPPALEEPIRHTS